MSTAPLGDLAAALPKAELHLHLEGSIMPALALQLARRHGIDLPGAQRGEAGVAEHYRCRDFAQFLRLYLAISSCLVDAEDFTRIVVELANRLAEQNVRHAEVTFTPMTHVARGVPADEMLAGLARGRADARDRGVEIHWVFDIVRVFPDQGMPTVDIAADMQRSDPGSVVGLGLGGPEDQSAPYAAFAEAFARARAEGLASLPHAGELAGPESMWGAVETLGAQRIGHGVRCLEDRALVDTLIERGIVLEVCPTSNCVLGVVSDIAAHPLPRLLQAGIPVTLASDDPALFGTSLVGELQQCIETFGWDEAVVRSMAAAGVEHSLAPKSVVESLRRQQDAVPAAS